MNKVIPINVATLITKKEKNEVVIIDVREANEFATAHIPNAISLPLTRLDAYLPYIAHENRDIVFQCQKGQRGATAAEKAIAGIFKDRTVYNLDGGIEAWQIAGEAVVTQHTSKIPLNRQVFIAVGSLVTTFSLMALSGITVAPWVTLLIGFGLLFAGFTGWCGMALFLQKMPWNKNK